MKFASLFAGIGGFDLGLQRAGLRPTIASEILPTAVEVLRHQFEDVEVRGDVRELGGLPGDVEVITAGFPCQDLSQAGRAVGISGARSSLVGEVFRLAKLTNPRWLILENVPFMLQLQRGEAMRIIVDELEAMGYRWAWRVLDTYSFGLPQRRERVFIVASRVEDPSALLLSDTVPLERPKSHVGQKAHGFYWTEGRTGLGWAPDAVPTLKNGSAVGIPSPPAILLPSGMVIKPDIRDAERLQGFPVDWTAPALAAGKNSSRWALVGSAVSVPVATWLGQKLANPGIYETQLDYSFNAGRSLPRAARFDGQSRYAVDIGPDAVGRQAPALAEFLMFPGAPLSIRATASFLERTRRAKLRFQPGFIEALELYLEGIVQAAPAAAA